MLVFCSRLLIDLLITCFFFLPFCYFTVAVVFFSFCLCKGKRGYKAWDKDGLGEDKLVAAMKLVLGETPVSARQACKEVFGEGYPNVHRTLGNAYKDKFGESIGLAKKLTVEVRRERCVQLDEEWIQMKKPGNPDWEPYLTPDEELLIANFLKTCNFMHMPFNRDGFKVSRNMHACM